MVSLSRFYAEREHMERVLPYVTCTSGVSLRLLDWFVTNYAKKHTIILPRATGGHLNVYLSYRAQLKAYSKQQFDPFRRRDRIMFCYDRETAVATGGASGAVETTVGQLNFFRWMLQMGVLDYVLEHAEAVERDMLAVQRPDDAAAASNASQVSNAAAHPDAAPHDPAAPCAAEAAEAAEAAGRQATKGLKPPPAEKQSPPGAGGAPARRKRVELTEACVTTRVMTRVVGRRTLAFD